MDFIPSDLPIENEYPKLVRDRIPEKIQKQGKISKTRILVEEELLEYLFKKMIEESTELQYSLQKGNTKEELADLLELIDAILKFENWKLEDIIAIQKEKKEKNGGFEKRILLLEKP